jgi:hypothetical protein
MALIKCFKEMTKGVLLGWMRGDHQSLLFYVVKEFLLFSVKMLPAILDELKERYFWTHFNDCVVKAMNTFRHYKIFDFNDPLAFKGMEQHFASVNKQQVHYLFRPHRMSFSQSVIQECERMDDVRCIEYTTREFRTEYHDLMWELAKRATFEQNIPIEYLEFFNIKKKSIQELSSIQDHYNREGSKSNLKTFLSDLSRLEFETVRSFAEVFHRLGNFRRFTLPAHIYIMQHKALRRKYAVQNGDPLPDGVGEALLCLHCKTFKSFINQRDSNGHVTGLYAYGHSKILVDDETMELYCAKRSDKIDSKKRIPVTEDYMGENTSNVSTERAKKRAAKERRKESRSKRCSDSVLTTVNLLGIILQFYGRLYTVCPICGNFMIWDNHFTKETFYCGCCLKNGKLFSTICCMYCNAVRGNENWTTISVISDSGEQKSIYLCNTCLKPWIRNSPTPLKQSDIITGLKQKWKRLQHPSNT